MFKSIYTYELKYWLKKPVIYIYSVVFFLIAGVAFIGSTGIFDGQSVSTKLVQLLNSPYEINNTFQYFNKFFLFLLPAIIGVTIYKDYKDDAHSIIYSFPIRKKDYLFGKFLGALTIVVCITFFVGFTIVIAEHLPFVNTNKLGTFNILGYLQAYAVYVLPNMLFYGAIVFAVVTYFRDIYAGFVTVIILFFLQNITLNVFNDIFIALFDPLAQNAAFYETQYWTLEDKNTKLIPVVGVVLYNRLIWLTIAMLIFGLVYKKFSYSEQPITTFLKKKKSKRKIKNDFRNIQKILLPKVNYTFSLKQQLKNTWQLSNIDFLSIIKNKMFYIIVAFGMAAVLFAIGKVTNNSEMVILPVTHVVLTIPAFFFTTIIMLLTFIFSGMLVHRDNVTDMNQLVDSTPISNWSLLISKVIAIIKMQLILLLIMMLAGITIQIYNAYYNFEIGLYLFDLFIIKFIGLIIWAFASVFIHTILKNTYLGIFILVLGWLGISGIKEAGIKTQLLLFNFYEPIQYSDINKYGNLLEPYFLVKSYWFVFGLLLLLITYLFWIRGLPASFKERIEYTKSRFNSSTKIIVSILITAFMALGFTILKAENKSLELPSKEQNNAFNKFEENYKKYVRIVNQPRVTDIDLNINLYPKTNSFTINGSYTLVNKSSKAIDTLLIKTGFDETTTFTINIPFEIIDKDTYVKFSVLKLKNSLQPNDSLELTFEMNNKPNTFFENNSNILNNGTFFKNDILPRVGYFLNIEKKHPSDSTAKNKHYYSQDSDLISLKTRISTSKNQTAIAPGYLKKQWAKNSRNYFEYQTDSKIKNSLSFSSGNYQVSTENYKGVDLEIYHHKNHTQNLSKMVDGLKASLEYNTKHFGTYQYKEARIIEFPITEGTYASVMANSIPTSEMRFIANSSSNDKIDLSFYTIAHELTHQWWGNQVVPADALGAVMLSESITEYISLNIYKEKYGKEKTLQFLQLQRERYLKGRTQERDKEPPLMLVKGEQQYLAYGKGTLVFNTLSHYLGKSALHSILKDFLNDYKYKEAPYPTSIDFINRIKKVTPDSLQYVIKDLFETITFYDTKINSVTSKNNNVIVNFDIIKYRNEGLKKSLPLNEFIELGFYNVYGELISIEKVAVNKKNNIVNFQLNEKPVKVILDPNYLLIDKNVENNEYHI